MLARLSSSVTVIWPVRSIPTKLYEQSVRYGEIFGDRLRSEVAWKLVEAEQEQTHAQAGCGRIPLLFVTPGDSFEILIAPNLYSSSILAV